MASFAPDGTFALDQSAVIDRRPAARGTFEVAGDTITFTNSGSDVCIEGDVWAWKAVLSEDGRLHIEHVEPTVQDPVQPIPGTAPGCAVPYGTEWNFIRVSPRSLASSLIAAQASAQQGGPPTSNGTLAGMWLREGGNHLIRFGTDGTYTIIARGRLDQPEDVGTFAVDGQGTITFTSGAESPACPQGTETVWDNVLVNLDALRGDIGSNACGDLPEGQSSWVRLLTEDRA
jgi:hypothetical protein